MLSNEDIKRLCVAPESNKAYFRPFLCKGDLSNVDIFLVGINPATPILQSDLELVSSQVKYTYFRHKVHTFLRPVEICATLDRTL